MKTLRFVSRIITGLVFMFSGVVKAIDPLGSVYKFHDYFQAYNIGFADRFSLPFLILLCTAEFCSGFSVITGLRVKTGIWIMLILMMLFTPLTFILALTNPVSDCGCFGDAIHLTNWQTFGKNLVLLIMVVTLFISRKQFKNLFSISAERIITIVVILFFILFIWFNLRYLPVVDFLPYKTGVKISEKMIVPPGVQEDVYQTTFIYEKNGVRKVFDLNNYPANDTTWKFVDQKSVLIKKGYRPPIHDFVITSMNGEDLTQKILSYRGYSLLMISRKLALADKKNLSDGFDFGRYCLAYGIEFYILSASGANEVKSYDNGLQFCAMDETTLKTMIRANPGYILLKDGIIIAKWSWANLPDKERFIRQNSVSQSKD